MNPSVVRQYPSAHDALLLEDLLAPNLWEVPLEPDVDWGSVVTEPLPASAIASSSLFLPQQHSTPEYSPVIYPPERFIQHSPHTAPRIFSPVPYMGYHPQKIILLSTPCTPPLSPRPVYSPMPDLAPPPLDTPTTSTGTDITENSISETTIQSSPRTKTSSASTSAAKIVCLWARTDGEPCGAHILRTVQALKHHLRSASAGHIRRGTKKGTAVTCQWRIDGGGSCEGETQCKYIARHIMGGAHVLTSDVSAMRRSGAPGAPPQQKCPFCPTKITLPVGGRGDSMKRHIALKHPEKQGSGCSTE